MGVSFLTGIGLHLFPPVSICPCSEFFPRRGRWKDLKGWRMSPVSEKLASWRVNDCNGGVFGRGKVEGEADDCVEVMMVGSRRDSLMEFCSGSPFLSPVLRFWCILGDEPGEVRLQERFIDKGGEPSKEYISTWQPSCKAVILVVSAAYGRDNVVSLEVVSNVKSRKGLVVGLILKPFSFEGKRRQEEVNTLSREIQKLANFSIVLDTDALLENDLVTLDEACRTSNNAALMVMNAVSILFSDKHRKILNTTANITRDLQLSELQGILKGHTEARITFGMGYNVEASLSQAINGFNFLGMDKSDPDGLIFCTIGTSSFEDSVDMSNVLQTVRSTVNWNGKVILSVVVEPNLEPNALQATILFFGLTKECLAPRNGILFTLEQYFPFIFNIFKKRQDQSSDRKETPKKAHYFPFISNENSLDATTDDSNSLIGSIFPLVESRDEVDYEETARELADSYSNYPTFELNSEGYPILKGEQLARGTLQPGYTTELSKFCTSFSEENALDGTVSIFQQPVGVKNSKNFEEASTASKPQNGSFWGVYDNVKWPHGGASVSSLSSPAFFPKEVASQGGLSIRAASMLESERDTYKKWSRVVEMKYRGGTYIGHVQGGLPEGKGRLLLIDGSIYDGMWRCGKRSGMGTFYFNNGDVFKGLWRDDVMHGKGWIYFHTGDRWFVNFWKGRPNGEGRYYSRVGDIFFGNFKDGWRHGHFLRIDVDGSRYQEVWDEGVLATETQLDPDAAETE